MSSEIQIVAPQSINETEALSLTLAKSTLLPEALRGKQADILATILTGAELGLAPMQSLRGIQVIKGKPTLSADTMGALCKRRSDICEHLTLLESSATRVTYETKRRGEAATKMTFTLEDAQRAGLAGSDTYKRFPAAMLRARCLSAICRAVYPDLCLGLYDPDELRESPIDSGGEREMNAAPVVAVPVTTSRTDAVAAKVSRARAPKPPEAVSPAPASPPPKPRATVVDIGPDGSPVPVMSFGTAKGRQIQDLTLDELRSFAALGAEKIREEPTASWVASVEACLANLERERVERAIAASNAAAPEPGSAG